ncbi:hypothetical protein [Paenibacillus amylolyticus]|uniref:hypothetical protein n=1 Tax=Paenibacillus TaxID=44249 RepID=UPI000FDB7286|nr:hypothetical protein [Paenibacillus amylolyticus]
MLEDLITQGKALESHKSAGAAGTFRIDGPEYEKWAAQVVFYLEQNHAGSTVTKAAQDLFTSRNRYAINVYERLLGALEGAKGIKG